MNDVLIAKKVRLERCVEQVRKFDMASGDVPFAEDFMRQDAMAMNLQRACELAIDMANVLIRLRKLGVPQTSSESFGILGREAVISTDLADRMVKMVGFRNVLVHRYQDVDLKIFRAVVDTKLDDLLEFAQVALLAG